MDHPESASSPPPSVEDWELDVIREVASRFRTNDRAELRAELARQVLDLKYKDLSHVKNWEAYLRWYVGVKAIDFVNAFYNTTPNEAITIVPEPGTMAMMAIGAAAMLGVAIKRRRG